MEKHFNDDNFAQDVIEMSKTKPVLVDFYADWCAPCRMQGPIVEEVATEFGDKASIGKLNTEEAGKTAQGYGVMSIPTIIIFRNGEVAQTFVGVQPKEVLIEEINKHI